MKYINKKLSLLFQFINFSFASTDTLLINKLFGIIVTIYSIGIPFFSNI